VRCNVKVMVPGQSQLSYADSLPVAAGVGLVTNLARSNPFTQGSMLHAEGCRIKSLLYETFQNPQVMTDCSLISHMLATSSDDTELSLLWVKAPTARSAIRRYVTQAESGGCRYGELGCRY